MKVHTEKFLIIAFFLLMSNQLLARQSALSSGRWFKVGVIERGIYKLDQSFIENNFGISINEIDPATIRIYSNGGGGMLPQLNSAPRKGLVENSISVIGGEDGTFDAQDFVLFYGNDHDRHDLDEANLQFIYEQNLYSDTTFYFVNIGQTQGKRIDSSANLSADGIPIISSFDDYVSYEIDQNSVLTEGRQWFDRQMFSGSSASLDYTIDLGITGINNEKEISLTAKLLTTSTSITSFDLSLNNEMIDNIEIPARPLGDFNFAGITRTENYSLATTAIPNISNQMIFNLVYNPEPGLSNGYLDFLFVEFSRDLKLYGNSTFFRSFESIDQPISTFQVSSQIVNAGIWDVTDNTNPINLNFEPFSDGLQFTTNTNEIREFVVFNINELTAPVSSTAIANQNILTSGGIDALIVTHKNFLNEANRLADFRRSNDQLAINVVTVEEIYNAFSSGSQDLTAIRDYIRYLYQDGAQQLKYVLLFGDCSYDYKKRFPINTNFLPIYEARESLHPIFSYSSDDYYGFMEDEEGEWIENDRGDHTLELGIGRLPAKSEQEARVFVDKIIRYSSSLGSWRNDVYFVADDGDSNIHQRDAERLSNLLENSQSQFNSQKIYLDAFEQVTSPNGERSPITSRRINDVIEEGALIVNYTGHGNTQVWTDERVFDRENIQNLSNRNRLPLFVTATCQFGKYDDPIANSGGEELLLNPNGGAIGLVTTTRPVFSNTNFVLNRAFYNAAFNQENELERLGDILRVTKNSSLRGAVNRNFALLGDPMMRLNTPQFDIKLDEVLNITNDSDTISALSQIRLKGSIIDNDGNVANTFNGQVTTTILDKPTTFRTLGDQNAPFDFSLRNTILFNGEADVNAGRFEIEFIVPINIAYNFDAGKISFYAINEEETMDASGANIEVIVGGSANEVTEDENPPELSIFLNDSTFQSGQNVGKDPLLLVRLRDESGINVSNRGFGQNMVGILDDTTQFVLNEFYTASPNTFQEGWVVFPLRDISNGRHQIKIKVWDVHNNLSESEVDFVVSDESNLNLISVYNFPNPINTTTTFLIEHDREGEELLINLNIFSLEGQTVHTATYRFDNPDSRIDEIQWDGNNTAGATLKNGVYIYRIKVQSTLDGASNEIFRRLVISK